MKKILIGLLAITILISTAACGKTKDAGIAANLESYQGTNSANGTGYSSDLHNAAEEADGNKAKFAVESDVVIESDTLVCTYDYETNSLSVKDKISGRLWYSTVQDDMYDFNGVNKTWVDNMKSLFILGYTNFKENKGRILKVQSTTANLEVSLSRSGNALEAEYKFPDLAITISFEFILDGDTLIVRIPENRIKEEGIYGIVGVEIMPFMGAAENGTDGYMFIPDGSGALVKFEKKTGQMVSGAHRRYIYGVEPVEVQRQRFDPETEGVETVFLPVYGIKTEDSAFIAYITEGDADASINLSLSGHAVALNRVFAEFTYRRTYNASKAKIDLRGKTQNLIDYKVVKEMIPGDREIRYTFLRGDDADYSGMACAYRNYLMDIQKMVRREYELSLALDLFMGIKEKKILFDHFVKMTDFEQAKNILEELRMLGVDNMEVNLIGWTSGGYDSWPKHFPVERKLGGISELRELSKYIREIGSKIYLQSNFVDAYAENGGFSKRNDTVKYGNGETVTNTDNSRFLLNPIRAFARLQSELDDFIRTGVNGINFERAGSYTYYDYSENNPVTREMTTRYMEKMLSVSREKLGSAAVHGGNAYVLAYADRLFDIPISCSGYLIYDESIPFFQIVVHGSIPYTSQPGNLFYDFEKQKLQWIEYGCTPYFMLTYDRSFNLKNTDYNHLFTSYYPQWVKTASEVYQEFKERLDGVWGQLITEHTRLEKDIARITFENGSRVYINYGSNTALIEGIKIQPMDYTVVLKGGVTR